MKRLIATLLTLLLLSSCLPAIAQSALEHKTIKIVLEDDGGKAWGDPNLPSLKKLAEAANVTLEIIPLAASDFKTKMTALIAGGDIPDLMYVAKMPAIMKDFGPKGLFLNTADLIDKMPNFKKRIEPFMTDWQRSFRASDGNVYGFPFISESTHGMSFAAIIRPDQLGKPASDIKTIEDLLEALRALKASTGVAPWITRLDTETDLPNALERTARLFRTGIRIDLNPETDIYEFCVNNPGFLDFLTFMSTCYAEGLLHPEFLTMRDEQYSELLTAGKWSFIIDNYKDKILYDFGVAYVVPPLYNGKTGYGTTVKKSITTDKYWAISSKTKALDNILALLDYACSDEFVTWWNEGVEGETYQVTPDGMRALYTGSEAEKDFTTLYNFYTDNGCGSARNAMVQTAINYEGQFVYNFAIADLAAVYPDSVIYPAKPDLVYTPEENEIVKGFEATIFTYLDEQMMKFISGQRPMSEYEAFVAEINAMGVEQLVKAYNDAYLRYK